LPFCRTTPRYLPPAADTATHTCPVSAGYLPAYRNFIRLLLRISPRLLILPPAYHTVCHYTPPPCTAYRLPLLVYYCHLLPHFAACDATPAGTAPTHQRLFTHRTRRHTGSFLVHAISPYATATRTRPIPSAVTGSCLDLALHVGSNTCLFATVTCIPRRDLAAHYHRLLPTARSTHLPPLPTRALPAPTRIWFFTPAIHFLRPPYSEAQVTVVYTAT